VPRPPVASTPGAISRNDSVVFGAPFPCAGSPNLSPGSSLDSAQCEFEYEHDEPGGFQNDHMPMPLSREAPHPTNIQKGQIPDRRPPGKLSLHLMLRPSGYFIRGVRRCPRHVIGHPLFRCSAFRSTFCAQHVSRCHICRRTHCLGCANVIGDNADYTKPLCVTR